MRRINPDWKSDSRLPSTNRSDRMQTVRSRASCSGVARASAASSLRRFLAVADRAHFGQSKSVSTQPQRYAVCTNDSAASVRVAYGKVHESRRGFLRAYQLSGIKCRLLQYWKKLHNCAEALDNRRGAAHRLAQNVPLVWCLAGHQRNVARSGTSVSITSLSLHFTAANRWTGQAARLWRRQRPPTWL